MTSTVNGKIILTNAVVVKFIKYSRVRRQALIEYRIADDPPVQKWVRNIDSIYLSVHVDIT